jgi:hypothetical protein
MTPEEIADIATKHNGGKFLSLTNLVTERVEQKIYRNFSGAETVDEIHEAHAKQLEEKNNSQAKILPFKKEGGDHPEESREAEVELDIGQPVSLSTSVRQMITTSQKVEDSEEIIEIPKHKEDENMSSFILIEKARLKKSQKTLKQKEIIDLYQKTSITQQQEREKQGLVFLLIRKDINVILNSLL